IVFTTHHPEHALFVAGETLLMLRDATHVQGATDDVVTEANLSRMYGVAVRRVDVSTSVGPVSAVIPLHRLRP
ncbi:hypothetical protein ACSTIA_23840, partial [Vibrio parahaemolyticus]